MNKIALKLIVIPVAIALVFGLSACGPAKVSTTKSKPPFTTTASDGQIVKCVWDKGDREWECK